MKLEDIKALPVGEKIQIMEAIWDDLRERFEKLDVTAEQKELLNSRRARVRDGTGQLLNWDSVKGSIGKP